MSRRWRSVIDPLTRAVGLRWSSTIDAFGAGCVLAEVCIGRPLFKAAESIGERMIWLERVIEPIPSEVVLAAHETFRNIFRVRRNGVDIVAPRTSVRELVRHRIAQRQPSLQVSAPV